jgi:hypothetical protein
MYLPVFAHGVTCFTLSYFVFHYRAWVASQMSFESRTLRGDLGVNEAVYIYIYILVS